MDMSNEVAYMLQLQQFWQCFFGSMRLWSVFVILQLRFMIMVSFGVWCCTFTLTIVAVIFCRKSPMSQ